MLPQRYKIFYLHLYYRIKNEAYLSHRPGPVARNWVPDQTKHRVPNSDGDAVESQIAAGTGRNRRCAPCR